jgi:hypothetical protein
VERHKCCRSFKLSWAVYSCDIASACILVSPPWYDQHAYRVSAGVHYHACTSHERSPVKKVGNKRVVQSHNSSQHVNVLSFSLSIYGENLADEVVLFREKSVWLQELQHRIQLRRHSRDNNPIALLKPQCLNTFPFPILLYVDYFDTIYAC